MGLRRNTTLITTLARRSPELAKRRVKRAIDEGRGNKLAIARLLQVGHTTVDNLLRRYDLRGYLEEVRACVSPAMALRQWWIPGLLDEVNKIRAQHGLAPYFPKRHPRSPRG